MYVYSSMSTHPEFSQPVYLWSGAREGPLEKLCGGPCLSPSNPPPGLYQPKPTPINGAP